MEKINGAGHPISPNSPNTPSPPYYDRCPNIQGSCVIATSTIMYCIMQHTLMVNGGGRSTLMYGEWLASIYDTRNPITVLKNISGNDEIA